MSRCLFELEGPCSETSDGLLLRVRIHGEPDRDTGSGIGEQTTMLPGLGGGEPCYVSLEHACADRPA
jgi:hypothetical protein